MLNLKKNDQIDILLFLIVLSFVILYFYHLGYPSIWNPNEAFYAETPREMLERRDFLTPYFNYEYRFQKPVFMYWLVLPWYVLLGYKEIAVRMVSAVAATWGVIITYWLAKTIWNSKRSGLISAAILASAFDYNSAARYASPEMLLTVLITSSLVVFYKGYMDSTKYKSLWYFLVYVLCGFATLTKGPIGIILPFLIILVFFLVKKDIQGLKHFISIKGFLIYLLISSSWYLLMIHKHGNEFFSVVYGENVSRFLGKKGRTSSVFFYFTVLPWNFLPGSVFLLPAFLWVKRNIKKADSITFPLIWFFVVFIFFSLSKSKLPPYIYPLFPAIAIIVGGWIRLALDEQAKEGTIFLWLSPIVLLTIVAGVFWLKSYLPEINIVSISILLCIFLISLWNVKKKMYYLSLILSLVGMSIFYFVFLSDIIPQIEEYRHYKTMAHHVNQADPGKKAPFYCYDGYQQNLTFYLKRKVVRVQSKDEFMKLLKDEKDAIFLLKEKSFKESVMPFGKKIVWKGLFYDRSESRFMRFLIDIKNGRIDEYVIIQ